MKYLKKKKKSGIRYLVDVKPSTGTVNMIDMFARKSNLVVASFVFHLTNHTPTFPQEKFGY